MSLQQFLKEQADWLRSPEARQVVSEWTSAVSHLMNQIQGWLEEADTEQILQILTPLYELREEGLPQYAVRGLDISLGGRTAQIIPIARKAIGPYIWHRGESAPIRAQGLVELRGSGLVYRLYRYNDPDGVERWELFEEDRLDLGQILDRAVFEKAMTKLLS
ncbi:hypothetical protein BH23PLA1_BH23PLA1_15870 [soil metagenome]